MTTISRSTSREVATLMRYITASVCLAILLSACQTPEQKVVEAKEKVTDATQDLKEATREVRAQWQEDWLTFKRDNDKDIAANERRIIELRKEVTNINTRYRPTYNARIDELERGNNELRDRVNNCRDEGNERWEAFKRDTQRTMDTLKTTLSSMTIKNG
jgi:Zn-dependent M32 family carboxypeptidase